MAEHHGSLGYCAIKKETTKGTAVTPDVYYPIYSESMTTNMNFDEDAPIVGNDAELFQVLPGQRTHTGNIEFHGEPNVAGYILDMIANKGTTTGSDPYTHPFTFSSASTPNSYTIDILKGQHVFRFIGAEARELTVSFNDNTMHMMPEITALKSFTFREITSDSGTGPTTINLKRTDLDYVDVGVDTALVVGDLVQAYDVSAGTYINGTVASLVDADTFTVTEDWSAVDAGDIVSLRTATASYSLKPPFQEARTEFRFAADAATALTATHTGVEKGAGSWTIRHMIVPDEGALRTGSHDPASLPRGRHGGELKTKIFFDTPEDYNRYLSLDKRACVIRHFVTDSSSNAYELRVTFNNLRMINNPTPLTSDDLVYSENEYKAVYDVSDAQAMDIKVLNAISSI